MENLYYKRFALCFFLVLSYSTMAQSKASKEIKKTYQMFGDGALYLDNKYGDVIVYGWDKETIDITISIEANRKDLDDAKALLNRIKPIITTTNKQVLIKSEIEEKKKGFFSKFWNEIDPFKNDKASTSINYTIYLPKSANVEINNKYGDLIITDWNGKLEANVEHGDIRTTEQISNAILSIKYGKLKAIGLEQSKIEAKDATINIDASKAIRINSSGSEIDLNVVEKLELYSNKDKVEVNDIQNLFGTVKYSTLIVNNLKKADLDLRLADLRILKFSSPSPSLSINQEVSEVYLNISKTSFDFSAKLKEGVLRIPKTMENINSQIIDKKNKVRNVIATYGNTEKGTMVFTGEKGVIILKEL